MTDERIVWDLDSAGNIVPRKEPIVLPCVQGEGNPVDQVRAAMVETYGVARVIVEIGMDTEIVGGLFPQGTLGFLVTSEETTCTHDPRCRWHDCVFYYQNRCVVCSVVNMHAITQGSVVRRLVE